MPPLGVTVHRMADDQVRGPVQRSSAQRTLYSFGWVFLGLVPVALFTSIFVGVHYQGTEAKDLAVLQVGWAVQEVAGSVMRGGAVVLAAAAILCWIASALLAQSDDEHAARNRPPEDQTTTV